MNTIPKQARNKVLRDVNRLITATMDGVNWSCPDGWFGINLDLYDGYRVKKSQEVPEIKPDLSKAIQYGEKYVQVESETEGMAEWLTKLVNGDNSSQVSTERYEFIKMIYPDAVSYIATDYKYAPVKMFVNDQLVAVIMPVKE